MSRPIADPPPPRSLRARRLVCAAALAALAALDLLACSAKGPPAGPRYTPVNSPEAEPTCVDEWQAAKKAREDLLGVDTPAAREATAAAVFAHAECELGHFQAMPVRADEEEAVLETIRGLRDRHRDARNLFEEVMNYGSARWNVGALAGLGELNEEFAAKLRATPAPVDFRDPERRAGFREEIGELARTLEGDAAVAYAAALSARASVIEADAAVDGWVKRACAGLDRSGGDGRRRDSYCR